MTENKAISVLKRLFSEYELDLPCTESLEVLHTAIKALEEVQKYRAIGTVEELKQLKENGAFTGLELAQIAAMQMTLKKYREIGTPEECRAAVEKMKPKKTVSETVETRKCPICGSHDIFTYCGKCGQKMEW